jgi:SAM-dependent methyltransferase
MASQYSPDKVRRFFDQYAQAEIARHQRTVASRVGLEMHRRVLRRWIRENDRVLEIGAGPGLFTVQLAELGARVTVGDISERQLELNAEQVRSAGCEQAVESRLLVDIVDLSRFPNSSFDAAVAYGGPLSYVFDRAEQSLRELLRTVRIGGVVLLSVMSRFGSVHQFLDGVIEELRNGYGDEYASLLATGDQIGRAARSTATALPHEMHLFTWKELKGMIDRQNGQLVDALAANFLSIRADAAVSELTDEQLTYFLDWEEQVCRASGALDAGTHIIVGIKKTESRAG